MCLLAKELCQMTKPAKNKPNGNTENLSNDADTNGDNGASSEGQRLLLADSRSLAQLSEVLDYARGSIGRWRTGAQLPNETARAKLFEVLGISKRSWDLLPVRPAPDAESATEHAPTPKTLLEQARLEVARERLALERAKLELARERMAPPEMEDEDDGMCIVCHLAYSKKAQLAPDAIVTRLVELGWAAPREFRGTVGLDWTEHLILLGWEPPPDYRRQVTLGLPGLGMPSKERYIEICKSLQARMDALRTRSEDECDYIEIEVDDAGDVVRETR